MDAVINTSSSKGGMGALKNTRISPFLWSPWDLGVIHYRGDRVKELQRDFESS